MFGLFETLATDIGYLCASFGLMGIGLLFMGKARSIWREMYSNPNSSALGSVSQETGAFLTHFCFVLGCMTYSFGINNMGLCLNLTPTMALLPAMVNLALVATYMHIKNEGITGIPEYSGPPLPVKATFVISAGALVVNLVLSFLDGWVFFGQLLWLVILTALAVLPTQGIAHKLRSVGWKVDPNATEAPLIDAKYTAGLPEQVQGI